MTTGEKPNWVAVLPWIFLALLALGFGLLYGGLVIEDQNWRSAYNFVISIADGLLLSTTAHMWALCIISGRDVGDLWRPSLILGIAITLPASIIFPIVLFLGVFRMSAFGITFTEPLALLFVAGGAVAFVFLELRPMRSKNFAFVLGGHTCGVRRRPL